MCLRELDEHGFLCECSSNANSIMNIMNTGALLRILTRFTNIVTVLLLVLHVSCNDRNLVLNFYI